MRQLQVDYFRNHGFAGADDPAVRAMVLSRLAERPGDRVAGVDIVGQLSALGLSPAAMAGGPQLATAMAPTVSTGMIAGLHPQILAALQQQKQVKDIQDQINHEGQLQKQAQLSRARFLPTKRLGVNSSAGTNIDGSGNVLAGATSVISVTPSVEGRITGFQVAPSCAPFFDIVQITVAMVTLLAGSLGEPAENYLPGSEMSPLEVERAPAGTPILVTVQNRDGVARFFRGGFGFIKLGAPSQGLY